jgi:YidC/Oxa1 family membrane protein insertase
MDLTAVPIIGPLVQFGAAGLHQLATLLEPVAGSGAAALAVVLLTLAVRALLIPLDVRLVRAEGARRRLAPHIAELRRRWQRRPEELQRRTMQLYRDAGVSPVAGVGTMLAQAPIVSLLYLVLASAAIAGDPNPLQLEQLLGVGFGQALGASVLTGAGGAIALAAVIRQPGLIAIPKASSVAHVEANAAALEIELDAEDIAVLDRAFPPPATAQALDII